MNQELKAYIESEIIPRYDSFDKGHQRGHVNTVIEQALYLAGFYTVDEDMIYTAAAYHDTGLSLDRKTHHIESARIIRADKNLLKWFRQEQIETIADAAEDHRASSDHEPRTIYGKIVAEADRQIIPEVVIQRTIQYSFSHYPDLDKEGNWERLLEHMAKKYAEGGYLKLWVPESPNAERLEELRRILKDRVKLREIFEKYYEAEISE